MTGSTQQQIKLQKKIKVGIVITIIGLLLNGISAVPLRTELSILLSKPDALPKFLADWWTYVNQGVNETSYNYNFMRYGFDWLAFAHLLIAIAFFGPLRDPIKNEWIIKWGMIASALSVLMALGWERMRAIPMWWTCSSKRRAGTILAARSPWMRSPRRCPSTTLRRPVRLPSLMNRSAWTLAQPPVCSQRPPGSKKSKAGRIPGHSSEAAGGRAFQCISHAQAPRTHRLQEFC